MEALRLEGNACFATDAAKAAALYERAMVLYEQREAHSEDAGCTLEEYTRCAGNALTCLYKIGSRRECVALALRALRWNPIFAKANAFIGRCASDEPTVIPFRGTTPLLFLCRAIYLLPAMEESANPSIRAEIGRLLEQRVAAAAGGTGEAGAAPAAAVEVRGGSCGNGVFATADVAALTLVSDMRHPFSVASYEETGGRGLCASCGRCLAGLEGPGEAPLPAGCDSCGAVFYCSAACAEAHRESQHVPFECAKMRKLVEMARMVEARGLDVPGDFFEIATHTITTLAAYQARRRGWDELTRLESHGREVAVSLSPTVPLLHDLYADVPQLDKDFITEVVGIVRCNSLEVAEPSGMGVGQALHCGSHNITSFFNHSCAPNCAISSERHGIVTTRAVAAGEELCISYLPQLYWPCKLRRDSLSEHFYFTCQCPRCVGADTDPMERAVAMELPNAQGAAGATARLHVKVQEKCTEIRSLPIEDISASHVRAVVALQGELDAALFPFHYLQHELRNLLSFLYAVLGMGRECVSSCLQELLMWESIIPGALPVKQMKLRNALQGVEVAGGEEGVKAALLPHMVNLAVAYDVAEVEQDTQ